MSDQPASFSALFLSELDARAGALHRTLAQAVLMVSELESQVATQRLLPEIAADMDDAGLAVIRAALAYMDACRDNNASAMTRTFAALRRATAAWRVEHSVETNLT